ncbi:MAG: peptide deformylase [Alphaproteobacteria bacterium]|nr:peptide deformylase [Alphaproteobacteria bacterium]
MAVLSIIVAPDPRLKHKSERVEKVDAGIRRLMDDMMETMRAADGIGLAAPQVGILKNVIVIEIPPPKDAPDEKPRIFRMANPEIVWRSDEVAPRNEGCLSLPEQFAPVERPVKIRVRYLDHENEMREVEAEGLLAVCIQHEMDHLDGVLFVDHISALKRNMILRKLAKIKRQAEAKAEAEAETETETVRS